MRGVKGFAAAEEKCLTRKNYAGKVAFLPKSIRTPSKGS